ncbi:ATP-binding protein [Magnetospirillum sp. SS-4]|uniref:ATP-binding protein n=1 Tax=Magnetospirillum sp. SS-4 TaxID=2681465 RepID=UPI001382CE0D|nr:ATP-binding protein [Magnetospirillum sp. SS-4]CAA7618692.1 Signal transduction histidine kinase [Magnetospirillum sp. SS-4]
MPHRLTNRRLVIGLLGALLLALWGFVAYWSWSQRQHVMQTSTVLLEQLTSAVEEQTIRLFKQAEISLEVSRLWMGDHPNLDPGEAPAFIALVDRLRLISEGLLDLRMVNRAGGLHYIPKRGPRPLADVSDRDYFKAQSDPTSRGFFVGDPVISRVTGKWGIPVSIPIDKGGGNIGVLFAAMELDRIARTFEAERLKPDGAISIMRTDGTFLFRVPAGQNIIGRSIAGTPSWDNHISVALRGTYYSDGTAVGTPPKLVSFARLRDYPLYVTVTAEVEDLLHPWRRETYTLVTMAALVTLASMAFAAFLLRAMKAEERAQRETQRAHRDAELILSSAGEGICGIDADGRVGFINPAARRMLGWERIDPIGRSLHQSIHHSYSDGTPCHETDCPVTLTLADGQTREIAGDTFWRNDGSNFPVELIVTGVIDENGINGAVLVFRDITQRLETEHALMAQADELARSNADLEQFAYVASHDLREPLRQVASYVSLLERRYGERLDEDGIEFIRFARDGAKRMNQLIIDLLEFSRIGHQSQAEETVPLDDAVDQAISNLAPHIAESAASVERSNHLPVIRAVREDMIRLFQNLIGNALKYRDSTRSPVVRISARLEETDWVIEVSDNGIGISPEYHDKIFGIFQRLHTRDKFDGTGIGLAICKKIIERLGGRIRLHSIPGQGSSFHIVLPRTLA